MKRALIVVTSQSIAGTTGKLTGYYLPEVSHPYRVLKNHGYQIDFASPKGGQAPMDPKSRDLTDADNAGLLGDQEAMIKLATTITSGQIVAKNYDVIFFAGGLGTMWDFPLDPNLARAASEVYENGGIAAAVCHGPAALLNAKLKDGSYLLSGRRVAGFSNDEEAAAGNVEIVPFLLESELKERGADFHKSPLWQEHVEVSGRLVTGQNPASARAVAKRIVELQQ